MTYPPAVTAKRPHRLLRALLLAAALGTLPLAAQQGTEPPAKEISEKVSEEFNKLRPLIEAKNFPEALKLIDTVLAEIKTETYDFVLLAQMKSQILLTTGEMAKATGPLEQSLEIARRYSFLPENSY